MDVLLPTSHTGAPHAGIIHERYLYPFSAHLAASESNVNYTCGLARPRHPTKEGSTACWVQLYPQCFRYGQHIEKSFRHPSCLTVTSIKKETHPLPTILTCAKSTRLLASLRTGARQTGSSSRQETTKGTESATKQNETSCPGRCFRPVWHFASKCKKTLHCESRAYY